ncbi:ABC-type antimicrobial peptide transport system permease subunit [Algoriphagus iocasae]|uniref:ABC-type antimicrobial peptide transport system permease subunit n=1 Tax=Algoriphagus iocasae TaxID=1836499 RepID=A0A841MTL5_9BACT|nr:ABC transporter permease [Algoriphagus iocasae]MBB6325865.1 ABC-type antimicrobial peptide transport system permease subunit [Algoriphagus iocasae]
MLSNYIKTTFRYLWRHRLFTFLNILGLAIGISASWVIYRIVDFEFSYDTDLVEQGDVYRLVTHAVYDAEESIYGGASSPIYQSIRDEVPGVELVVPVYGQWVDQLEVPRADQPALVFEEQEGIVAVQPSYFNLKSYTWLAGDHSIAFENPENVVLTQSRAALYFPETKVEDVLGKVLVYDGEIQRTVSGVVKDLDLPSEFNYQEFVYLRPQVYPLDAWTSTNGSDRIYLRLHPEAKVGQVLEQINELSQAKWNEFNSRRDEPLNVSKWYSLLPMEESHFSTHVKEYGVRKASKPVLYSLVGVAGFLLLLAYINYINLSTAQIPQRTKEIGVRKTLGGSKSHLIGQVISETFVTVLISALVAFVMTKLSFSLLEGLIPEGVVEYTNTLGVVLFFLLILGLTTFLSGAYPAWLISTMQPIGIIKGSAFQSLGKSRLTLRKGLIIFQFTIAQVFIVCALFIGQQLSFTLKKDMGFDKEAVVLVQIPWKIQRDSTLNQKIITFSEELKKENGIQQVSMGREPLSAGYSSSPFRFEKDSVADKVEQQLSIKWVDTTYIHLYGMELIAGRNLRDAQQVNEYVINETAARNYGFQNPADAVGKLIGKRGEGLLPIVGVVKDFHTRDFYSKIEPIVLMYQPENFGTINIKLDTVDPAQWQKTLASVEQKWYSFYPPETYAMKFYDETIQSMYEQERNMAKLINLATGIAILISCLGLFGLASLTAFQRTKEIGIRKVLGASLVGIVALLSKDFVKLVLIAILVATPFGWWFTEKWLQDFAYKIELHWWVFAFAGFLACLISFATVSFQSIKTALLNPVDSLKNE